MKSKFITHVQYKAQFKPARHTEKLVWDSNDTDILIWLLLMIGTIGYFTYGLLN
jgi:hypothetical protein